MEVDPGVTSGDYLGGFLLGTRAALTDKGRESITITIDAVTPRSVGALIALFERAVGIYADLVNINAYHQPGVEAGKKAAGQVLDLQLRLLTAMARDPGNAQPAASWAELAGAPEGAEWAFKILTRLAANPGRGVERAGGTTPADTLFRAQAPNRRLMPPPLDQDKREGA
jgi:glucose-6-phosphate isomerase